jgi:hypothetical protein
MRVFQLIPAGWNDMKNEDFLWAGIPFLGGIGGF